MCVLQGVKGELVWALTDGRFHWPGVIKECCKAEVEDNEVTVEWYGQNMSCQVSPQLAARSGVFALTLRLIGPFVVEVFC